MEKNKFIPCNNRKHDGLSGLVLIFISDAILRHPTNQLLYALLKIYARLSIPIFCRKLLVKNAHLLKSQGPLLLAVNHPNSFLDAVILSVLFKQPVYALARGDAFNNKNISGVLRALKILPVYREREGKAHLHRNYDTFEACINIFKKDGIVLIFTEALCKNEWHLRTLKKGTARLAVAAWQQNIPVKILPIGLNYSSFTLFGKNVHINIGEPISHQAVTTAAAENGKLLNEITSCINSQLARLVYEIAAGNTKKLKAVFHASIPLFIKTMLLLPALAGVITHCLLFLPIHFYCENKFRAEDHYDSAVAGLLFLLYPFYVLACSFAVVYLTGNWWGLLTIVLLPFFSWSYVQIKKQTDS